MSTADDRWKKVPPTEVTERLLRLRSNLRAPMAGGFMQIDPQDMGILCRRILGIGSECIDS